MRIVIFPSSRPGCAIYTTAAIIGVVMSLGTAWRDHQIEKDFADRGAVADVLPINGYIEHFSKTRNSDEKFNVWKSANLSFRTPDGETWTISHGLGDAEIETLRSGGTLHMQYLPEHPQFSARLEGIHKNAWEGLVLAAFLAFYAMLLNKPERAQ